MRFNFKAASERKEYKQRTDLSKHMHKQVSIIKTVKTNIYMCSVISEMAIPFLKTFSTPPFGS